MTAYLRSNPTYEDIIIKDDSWDLNVQLNLLLKWLTRSETISNGDWVVNMAISQEGQW
jgi:hypothetical protein